MNDKCVFGCPKRVVPSNFKEEYEKDMKDRKQMLQSEMSYIEWLEDELLRTRIAYRDCLGLGI